MNIQFTPLQIKKFADLLHDLAKGWLLGAVAIPFFNAGGIIGGIAALIAGSASFYFSLELYKIWEEIHE